MTRVVLVLATSAGGVGRHVRDLASALIAGGRDVAVCGPAATERQFRFTEAGAGFEPVEIAGGARPLADLRALAPLRRAVRGAAVVHAHGLRAGVLTALVLRRRAAPPYVVTWHNPVPGPAWARLARIAARRADVTLGVSGDLVASARRLGAADARLAPVGAAALPPPTRSRDAVRAALGAGDRALVLAVGRLHRQKGFDVLAEAAAGWTGRALTVVAGDGPERASIEAAVRAAGSDVRLLGRRDDVPDLLAASDVVVMPSRWEGSPLAAHEALQAGRPLVAAAVGGLPDLLGGGGALLIPAEDPGALRAAVLELLDDPSRAAALAAAGRAAAAAWPDAATACRRVIAVYDELEARA